ncbi:XRE family transcriptional regulator [Mesorhizobium sp. M3A.F.Ca.ET.080.04.2.1]|uniref:helix-turn-helix domain-containing protein n=1 Tax=Mesorhizobium sp. M3A.F.Ca.ET.080.04.2.1 TaxID=2493676 RepID=UPI000F753DAF|nr:helix-turn-helix transcriptional regulator [Mesorhizobium sp. M3A.F.Ca.ET.080.04.2.1]AZO13060.1 XRE family transcriptional regulator [Mesorhizobium sp. M3A.F.Ca.ET.080.04.2.1]RWF25674.1 MAG: XRE family transcriptional regulator [Mesorhizobium sp.]
MELFATNLRRRAEELGFSNAEVARRAGLSERRYGNYVSGRREPDLATLVRISSVLATTPTDLLTTSLEKIVPEQLARQRTIAALAVLRSDDLERVAVMVEALATERR